MAAQEHACQRCPPGPVQLLLIEQSIESQHNTMFGLVYAFMQASAVPALQDCMQQLIQAAQAHFQYEEALMRSLDFHDLKEHAKSHAQLLHRLETLQQRISGDVLDKMEMSVFLKHWAHAHLPRADARFAAFLHGGAQSDRLP